MVSIKILYNISYLTFSWLAYVIVRNNYLEIFVLNALGTHIKSALSTVVIRAPIICLVIAKTTSGKSHDML